MKNPVSLKELVATKIIYALLLVSYYWMWARTDWQVYYPLLQQGIGGLFIVFFIIQWVRTSKYKKEHFDEMAEMTLRKVDSVCLKLFIIPVIIVAWLMAVAGHAQNLTGLNFTYFGWCLIASILLLTIIRTILFVYWDKKGQV